MKCFSETQELALRALIQGALLDLGYGPRSTKSAPRRAASAPTPIASIAPERAWPANDAVLLTGPRVCTALGIGRTRLYELMAAGRLRAVRAGRTPMFRPADVFAFIDSLVDANEEEAA